MRPFLIGVLAAALLVVLSKVTAQEPSPLAPQPSPPPAFSAVRRAWLVPERDFDQAASSFSTLGEFAVAAMISHAYGKPLSEVQEAKRKLGSWAEVVRNQGGYLYDIVFMGSARYRFEPLAGAASSKDAAGGDRRLIELAKVMTLERLTGKAPSSIARDLREGKEFEALLMEAMPRSEITGKKPERDEPAKAHGRGNGPPRMEFDPPPSENHGNIGSGLGH